MNIIKLVYRNLKVQCMTSLIHHSFSVVRVIKTKLAQMLVHISEHIKYVQRTRPQVINFFCFFSKVHSRRKSTLGCYIAETMARIASNDAPYER